ncbi:hypothetical protein GCM10025868_22600 [Angustibacter aerolatus]|uniref:Alpha/beta hydrolase n=1 Tax=Angustibacter aerolatus TaxID=1162965 RepID=A0ABQ6JJM3_9ACTN|nr:alpha/beta hydrolase [Angustibacter aerolatus]GMA87010.1 hypothetical protein GCM10025868_22600 [Angustibacter aerolatus]
MEQVDERVASAVAHWAPRFTTNGVTVADFERITSGLTSWDDWCAAWSAVGAEHRALGEAALEQGRTVSAGEHLRQAALYFHFAKFLFVDDLDQMHAAHRSAVECLDASLPLLSPPGRRLDIPFEGTRLAGVLRLPDGAGPHPVVILLSGLDSTKEEPAHHRGHAARPRPRDVRRRRPGAGRGRGSPADPRRLVGAGGRDRRRADGGARLDAERIGVWGVSLGGYYSPRVAAEPGRPGAGVRRAGRALRLRRVLGPGARRDPRGVPRAVRQRDRRRRPAGGAHAEHEGSGRAHHRTAAGGVRSQGPADPAGARRAAGRRGDHRRRAC